jgi:hypothetical protein
MIQAIKDTARIEMYKGELASFLPYCRPHLITLNRLKRVDGLDIIIIISLSFA